MKNYILFLLLGVGCSSHSIDLRAPARERNQTLAEDGDVSSDFDMRRLLFPRDAANDAVFEKKAVGIFSNADTPTLGQLLDSAQSTIDIEIYEMEDPDIRKVLRRAMSERKVKVRIVQEPSPIGKKCILFPELIAAKLEKDAKRKTRKTTEIKKPYRPTAECEDMRRFVEEVRNQDFEGPKYIAFNKEELCGHEKKSGICFQHGKIAIIDKRFVLLSTGNFNSSNLCNLDAQPRPQKCNRDFSYVTRDKDVVNALSFIFEKDLLAKRYSKQLLSILKSDGLPDKLTVSPYSLEPLTKFISSAHRRIQIEGQYLRPDSGLVEVLIEKAKAGVDVEVLLTDLCYFGKVSQTRAKNDFLMFAEMEDAGVKLKMFTSQKKIRDMPGYLHAKAIVIDVNDSSLARAWVGSTNGSRPSLSQNREFGIFFNNFQRVQALSKFIDDDFRDPTLLSWRESIACHSQKYSKETSSPMENRDGSEDDDEDQ